MPELRICFEYHKNIGNHKTRKNGVKGHCPEKYAPHYNKPLKIKGEAIQLTPVYSESTDNSMFEKGKKLHVANSCYIPCSKAERLGSLGHAELVEEVAQISIEQQSTLFTPVKNIIIFISQNQPSPFPAKIFAIHKYITQQRISENSEKSNR